MQVKKERKRKCNKLTLKKKMRADIFAGRNMGFIVDDRTKNVLCEECKKLEKEFRKGVNR